VSVWCIIYEDGSVEVAATNGGGCGNSEEVKK